MITNSCVLQTKPTMASPSKTNLLVFLIWVTLIIQGIAGSRTVTLLPHQNSELHLQVKKNVVLRRRTMIGSVKPTCTYNECRGCRSRCRAEQVPVEGNDPINSAYHYRCVCHR
ncbi:EPIDERMAL PATTERNING FACTOR-like protein 9 [Lactuca sativa]|uniref:EPIDERMAL PATTERNING FACTOR-like protein 9 n=1 Tax=Lactuca sativa TaxID=4236 RepID=UPI000CAAEE44|nr:EPIDERMAL PATTERNING FACTOR-like protein 9 [Lactuca sativa]